LILEIDFAFWRLNLELIDRMKDHCDEYMIKVLTVIKCSKNQGKSGSFLTLYGFKQV